MSYFPQIIVFVLDTPLVVFYNELVTQNREDNMSRTTREYGFGLGWEHVMVVGGVAIQCYLTFGLTVTIGYFILAGAAGLISLLL